MSFSPLFEECADRLLDLVRGQAFGKQAALLLHSLEDFVARPKTQQSLSQAQSLGRLGEKGCNDVAQLPIELAGRSAMADEAD